MVKNLIATWIICFKKSFNFKQKDGKRDDQSFFIEVQCSSSQGEVGFTKLSYQTKTLFP